MDGIKHPLPILDELGREWGSYLKYLSCTSESGEDFQRVEDWYARENTCRLCNKAPETKTHLITECVATRKHVETYFDSIREIHHKTSCMIGLWELD